MSQKKEPRQSIPQHLLMDDDLDVVTGGQPGSRKYMPVSTGSCCKYYEPYCGGKDEHTCGTCKFSSGLGATLICEHPANIV